MNPQIAFLLNKSIESLKASNLDSAELYLKQALRLQSSNPHVLRLLGVVSAHRKQYLDALNYLNDSLKALPKNALALSNLGNIFLELEEYGKALDAYDKSIKLDPKYEEAWCNKGNALNALKRYDEALAHCDKALSLKPEYAEGWFNKGVALHELKRYDEALSHYDKALSLKPEYAEAWSNKGNVLNGLKRYDEALSYYDKALSLKPEYAEAWSNKGVALHELKRYDEALTHYDKALILNPEYPKAWSNKGVALYELKRFDEAIFYYEKALSLKPDIDWLFGDLLQVKMKICGWSGLANSLENISKGVMEARKVAQPFWLLSLNDDGFLHKKSAEIYAQNKYPNNFGLGPIPKRSINKKLQIGYFSADFRDHAVSILTAELFELHDKSRFQIIAFSFGADDKSPMRERLSQSFDQFIDVRDMSDLEIAKLARYLDIDIAIDLGGYTTDARTGVFAYRVAPIQASYIGYLGTMGTEYIDYLFADKTIIPDGSESLYSEKIIYLPSYQVNDRKRVISDRLFVRQELGLPEQGFVFCCFNNSYKILPTTFDMWMRILKAVEGSSLFLYAENKWVAENLRKEAEARDIDSTRLIFGGHLSADEYLARYRVCDLFLDTFPYNAGTTASDALWAGLPVLTMTGKSFSSRMAASLLNAVGLPELITNDQAEYEAKAIELATNHRKLDIAREKLASSRLTAPLFNTPLFTKNLEAAYEKMYEKYQADLQPNHIFIG